MPLTFSCSDHNDNDDNGGEPTILFDRLYSGTYSTPLKDGGKPYSEDKIYKIELKAGKNKTAVGKLFLKGYTIPIVAREY